MKLRDFYLCHNLHEMSYQQCILCSFIPFRDVIHLEELIARCVLHNFFSLYWP